MTSLTEMENISAALLQEQDTVNALIHALREQTRAWDLIIHQLQQPLAVVRGYAELLVEKPNTKQATLIHSQIVDLQSTIQKLLLWQKLKTNRAKPHFTMCELGRWGRPLAESFAVNVSDHDFFFVAPKWEDPIVQIDETYLQEAICTLLQNAQKYVPAQKSIWVSIQKVGEFAEFSVTDNGNGIKKDARETLFTPFKQGKGATGGVGLGLALCAQIAMFHSGQLLCTTKEGAGTQFTIRLPLAPQRERAY